MALNEEKLLNEIFVTLEYSDTFEEFVEALSEDALDELYYAIKAETTRRLNASLG